MGEHLLCTQGVAGSNPAVSTKYIKGFRAIVLLEIGYGTPKVTKSHERAFMAVHRSPKQQMHTGADRRGEARRTATPTIDRTVAPTPDLKTALIAHEATMLYAVRVWNTSASAQSVARKALAWLAHDAVCLHQAIHTLGLKGWAFATPILARSMLDLSLSVQVIVNASDPDVAAFEWLYAFAKDEPYRSDLKVQNEIAATKAQDLAQMSLADRKAAEAFLASSKAGHYWYSHRFKRPNDVIKAYGTGALDSTWRLLSGSSHGGWLGMRLFRPDPLRFDLTPREDAPKAAMGIIQSTKLLSDLLRAWERFVGGRGPDYTTIKALIVRAMALKPM